VAVSPIGEPVRAGRLRHRGALQRRVPGRDALGQPLPDQWEDVETLPMEIRDLEGRELLAAGAEHAEVTTEILMRFYPGVTAAMRVVHRPPSGNGEVYDIQAPLADTKRRQLQLLCSRGVSDG